MRLTIAIILMFVTLASTSPRHRNESRRVDSDTEQYIQECGAELKIPSSEMTKYRTPDGVPEDRIGQCFTKCMFEKFGVFDKESGYKLELIMKMMSENNHPSIRDMAFIGMIEKCAKEANLIENVCERAYHGAKCFTSEAFRKKNAGS
ncbi:general odorant-binding protein 99a-like [Episyrphus balteatus]|uniref:general odorant-binding protein 99a-like n=1 Tax=Episyrphus balteatus TaxID=286459 RepID=UPI00248566E8|nr:general odorant-binding protein 99a-like [Episyrphus balteatus]